MPLVRSSAALTRLATAVARYDEAVTLAARLPPPGEPTASTRPALPARVDSEIGRLRTVLVHRPADELLAVRRANAARMLYAGPVEVRRAQAEHDALAEALRGRGVEVLYVEQLLADVIADDRLGRQRALELMLGGTAGGVHPRLAALPAEDVARALIGGVPVDARRPHARQPAALPNLMFTRDTSLRIGRTLLVGAMRAAVRRREARLLDALYRLHPRFASARVQAGAPPAHLTVEGGDVLVADRGRVVIGISPRTTASAAHRFATTLLRPGIASEVLTVKLPRASGVHLDLVVTIVDRDTFAVWAPARGALRAHAWRATSSGVEVHAVADPFAWMSRSPRVIEIDGAAANGRRWDHGVNVLALSPGVVVAYADNVGANARLRAAGIEVLEVPGHALGRGCGGPRCLTCPIAREPVG
jgi:arginine deiminase